MHDPLTENMMNQEAVNVPDLLIERINLERQLKYDHLIKKSELSSKNYSELVRVLRKEQSGPKTEFICSKHPLRKGEFLDESTMEIKCSQCKAVHRGLSLVKLEGEAMQKAVQLFRVKVQETLATVDSFNIPPLLLKDLDSENINQIIKILALLKIEKVFISYCPVCLNKLTKDTARRFSCQKAHLTCSECYPNQDKCCYDKQPQRTDVIRPVALETLYTQTPVCPMCMENNVSKCLSCSHSFCENCISNIKRCPFCSAKHSGEELLPEPFLTHFSGLKCSNGDQQFATKISEQTCQLFCSKCCLSVGKLHTFEKIPDRLHEFLDKLIAEHLEAVTQHPSERTEASSKINDLRELVDAIPTASLELRDLLSRHPNINLQERADLLYYLKTDCTNCDSEELPESVGWRIPKIPSQDYRVAMRFADVLPPLNPSSSSASSSRHPPWPVGPNQEELVGVTVLQKIELVGVVMATTYEPTLSPELEYFKIYDAERFRDFGESLLYSSHNRKLFSHQRYDSLSGPLNYKVIRFARPYTLQAETPYIFKFKLNGSSAFYRGNPFTLQEVKTVVCPDLKTFPDLELITVFYFSGVTSAKASSGDNHTTGTLLGLVYH
jgi:hypothetical protein